MGCDQHGRSGASKAATRACRQAIEFNALPYMETLLRDRGYEGRADMLLKVEIGVPEDLVDKERLVALVIKQKNFSDMTKVIGPAVLDWRQKSKSRAVLATPREDDSSGGKRGVDLD